MFLPENDKVTADSQPQTKNQQPAEIVMEEIDSPTRNGNQPISNGTPIGTKTPIQLHPEMIKEMRDQLNQIYLAVTTPTNTQDSNQSMSPASNASQSSRICEIQRRLAFSAIPDNEKKLAMSYY